jgi:hypothetical protein
MQPLAYLRELASATSENDFVVAYAGLLQDQPDCPVGFAALLFIEMILFFGINLLMIAKTCSWGK